MLDLIELGRGKTEDPLVMAWALRRFSTARDRRLMEEAWFGDSILRHWLETDDEDVLCGMFDALPNERFSAFESVIAERLRGWPLRIYERAASSLLRNSPAGLIPAFEEEIARRPADYGRLEIIASCLDDLPMPSRLELLQSLADLLPEIGNEVIGRDILNRLLRPAFNLGPDVLSRILESAPLLRPSEGPWGTIAYFCKALLGGVHLFFDARDLTEETESAGFSERRPFFEAAAPLEECDRLLSGPISQAAALELLERHRPQVSEHLRRFLPELTSRHGATELDAACLMVAAVLDAYELREIDSGSLDLGETLRLMTLEAGFGHQFAALAERLRDFDPDEVAAGARATMEALGAAPPTARLVRAVGALELVELVPDLIEWADQKADDSVIDEAERTLAFMGEPAALAVAEKWDGFDFMQKSMGLRVLESVGGQCALDFALERHEGMFSDRQGRQDWCALVETAPDDRAVDLLARHVHRKQPEIDRSYCTLCVLTGREPENFQEVRQRVLERRRQATWTMSEPPGHLELELRCGECGEINTYPVRDVVISTVEDPGPQSFVREEFPCASCGEFPDFKLTRSGIIALTASIFGYGDESDAPLSQLNVNYRGKERSVAGVVEELGAALEREPRSVVDLLRMGRVQRLLGRPARALRFYAKAMEVAPDSMEASLGVAQIAAGRGEARKALDLLSRLQENEANWRFLRVDEVSPRVLQREFSSLRGRLRAALGEPSRAEDRRSGRNRRRTGRNEPCPCGSGKKYKKCCMRAER